MFCKCMCISGTLLLTNVVRKELPDIVASSVWRWDSRVGAWRCDAIHYAVIRKALGLVKKLGFVLAPARTRLVRKQNAGLLVGSPSFADTASRSRSQPKMEDNLFTSP